MSATNRDDSGDKLDYIKIGSTTVKDFDYDAAGRTTGITYSGATSTLVYDYESRITSISRSGVTTNTFAYNGLDTRISKVDSTTGGTMTFKRAGTGVTAPVLGDGAATYTPGISERRGTGTPVTTYFHSGLKNAEAQSGTGQTIGATKNYDAFGNLDSSSGTWNSPFSYGGPFGYQQDPDHGLKLLGHRYYDSSTGRFLTRDPIKDGRNWYGYCGNNPVAHFDAFGLKMWSLQKWLLTDDGYADEITYEGGLTQTWVSLENWGGHFKRRNQEMWGVVGGAAGAATVPYWRIGKEKSRVLPGASPTSSVARHISIWIARHLPGTVADQASTAVANGVKRHIRRVGTKKAVVSALIVGALFAEVGLAIGATKDTFDKPKWADVELIVEAH